MENLQSNAALTPVKERRKARRRVKRDAQTAKCNCRKALAKLRGILPASFLLEECSVPYEWAQISTSSLLSHWLGKVVPYKICHSLCIPSSVAAHLHYFQIGTIINKAAMNIYVQLFVKTHAFSQVNT